MKKHIILASLGLLLFSACEDSAKLTENIPGKEHMETAVGKASEVYEQNIKPGAAEIQKGASDEIAKLSRFEYKVLAVPSDETSKDLETRLNTLGQDGWECFSPQERVGRLEAELQIICKRRPASYLRYVPRWLP